MMSMCDCNQGRLPCTCKPEIKISTGHPDAGRIYAQALARVTAERDALQADLDAKDQRVDELEGLLKEAWSYAQHPQNVVATPSELGKRVDAALNHTPCCGSCPAGCIGEKP